MAPTFQFDPRKPILVAGAAGFVPSHVCQFYLEKGLEVVGVDNFVTGTEKNRDLLLKYPKFTFFEKNIYEDDLNCLDNFNFQVVFSLASPASPIDFAKIPVEIMRINGEGTRILLELARKTGALFFEASTSEVYGDPLIHPQEESYFGNVNPIGERSCYDESKRFAEALTMSYHRHYQHPTRIVRIFNTYGPRMRPFDGRVIPNFINQALKNEPLTIYGDGSQTRSYCYVDDLVEAIHQVVCFGDHTPYNIGNPDEYTVKETAELIINILNSQSTLSFHPLPFDDPKRRRPSIAKLQKISDYRPKVEFNKGIKNTALYFKNEWS